MKRGRPCGNTPPKHLLQIGVHACIKVDCTVFPERLESGHVFGGNAEVKEGEGGDHDGDDPNDHSVGRDDDTLVVVDETARRVWVRNHVLAIVQEIVRGSCSVLCTCCLGVIRDAVMTQLQPEVRAVCVEKAADCCVAQQKDEKLVVLPPNCEDRAQFSARQGSVEEVRLPAEVWQSKRI